MMTKFDPNAASSENSGVFGLPFTEDEASLVFLPVPWEATTSYGGGTSRGPSAILQASRQVDLYDLDILNPYEAGLFILPESSEVWSWNTTAKIGAQKIIEKGGMIENFPELKKTLDEVNELGSRLNRYVYGETLRLLQRGKLVGIVGGDHSVPFGAYQAIAETVPAFGILHFDAHSDTRNTFEGFQWSHASIMHNSLEKIPQLTQLTQVGIRDVCEEEIQFCKMQKNRVRIFSDRYLALQKFKNVSWATLCEEMISKLPHCVWISFDIDGLDPRFCPNTGTPVPGGLDFQEANYLLSTLVKSGRKIIGFDLNEVSPADNADVASWDANVGARLLYKLSAWTLASHGKAQILSEPL